MGLPLQLHITSLSSPLAVLVNISSTTTTLHINITAPTQHTFLYKAKVDTQTFERWKEQQGILVEFNQLESKIEELVKQCSSTENQR